MDIIPTNTSTFEGLVSKYAVDAKKSALENLAVWLERMDALLYSEKPYYLEVVRVQRRTVLTTIGLLSFRRRYYKNEIDGGYVCLLDSVIKIPSVICNLIFTIFSVLIFTSVSYPLFSFLLLINP